LHESARIEDDGPGRAQDRLGPSVIVGSIGRGIALSRTPAMHEAEGARLGFRYVYRLLDTDRMGAEPPSVADLLRAAEIAGYTGLNVTYPYKKAVIAHLDELSDAALAVGAVNTVLYRNGRRLGDNTDYWGFAESFRRGMAGAPRRCVLLVGAGGAGGAVANALLDHGVETLLIADVDGPSAAALARSLNHPLGPGRAREADDLAAAVPTVDGIVNATPVGTAKLPGSPVDPALLSPRSWIADIVYFPLDTELLRAARAAGCRTLPGAGMALFQAVRAFELFTGVAPDADQMKATFDSCQE